MKRPAESFPRTIPLRGASPGAICVAVDLSHIRPGGENGGVKPFIFEYLREIGRTEERNFTFIFLTWSLSHAEVRRIARPQDQLVCVRAEPGDDLAELLNWRAGEWVELHPPVDFLFQLGAQVLYAPLGSAEFACPGVPIVATIVDLLHRDYPHTLSEDDRAMRERHFTDLWRAWTSSSASRSIPAGASSCTTASNPPGCSAPTSSSSTGLMWRAGSHPPRRTGPISCSRRTPGSTRIT